MNEGSPQRTATRWPLAAGLVLAAFIEIQIVIGAPATLVWPLVAVAAVSVALAIAAPWALTLALLVAWPLLADPARAARILLGGWLPPGVAHWAALFPPYPLVLTVAAAAGLAHAPRRAVGGSPRAAPGLIGLAAAGWAIIAASAALSGFAAVNAPDSAAVWQSVWRELWRLPLTGDLQRLSPLGAGRAVLIALLGFAMIRDQVRARPGREHRAETALILSGVAVALMGLLQWFDVSRLVVDNPTWVADRRVTGPLRDPNSCATALAATLMLCAVRIPPSVRCRRAGRLIGSAMAAAIVGAALLLTGSRVAWLATVLVLAGAGLGAAVRTCASGGAPRAAGWRLVLAAAIAVVWGMLLVVPTVFSREASASNPIVRRIRDTVNVLSGEADPAARHGLAGRVWHWQVAASMIRAHPLTGEGLGTFRLLYEHHRTEANRSERQNAHSQPLQTWAETGLLGLLAMALVWGAALVSQGTPGGTRLALLAFLLTSLTAHPLVLPEMLLLLWALIALAASGETPLSIPTAWPRAALLCVAAAASLSAAGAVRRGASAPAVWGLDDLMEPDATGVPSVWMGREAGVELRVERPFLLLPIRSGHPDLSESPAQVTASIGGARLDRVELSDPFWRFWLLDLEPWMGQTIALELAASRTWSPQRALGRPDPRELSVALGPWEWLDTQVQPDPSTPEVWRIPGALIP